MSSPRQLLSLIDLSVPRRGLFEGQKISNYLCHHLGECTFDDLRIPLALMAVDLNTGRAVTLNQGRVVDAVRATIALPGVFKPVEREGKVLVDGGLLDNIPADVLRHMGADVIIAIDVMTGNTTFSTAIRALQERRYVPAALASTFEVMFRSLDVMMAEINRRRLEEAAPEIVIRPDVPPGIGVLIGFSRAAESIAAGEEATTRAIPRLRATLNAFEP